MTQPLVIEVWIDGEKIATHTYHTGEITIGRRSSCDIAIQHAQVSREHCIIKVEDSVVEDLVSVACGCELKISWIC